MNDCILIDNILIPTNKFIGLLPNDIFKFIKLLEIERTIYSKNQDYNDYIIILFSSAFSSLSSLPAFG
jgi:hypothetical protein